MVATWGNPTNVSVMFDHQMAGVGRYKVVIGAVVQEKVGPPETIGSDPDVLVWIWSILYYLVFPLSP